VHIPDRLPLQQRETKLFADMRTNGNACASVVIVHLSDSRTKANMTVTVLPTAQKQLAGQTHMHFCFLLLPVAEQPSAIECAV